MENEYMGIMLGLVATALRAITLKLLELWAPTGKIQCLESCNQLRASDWLRLAIDMIWFALSTTID